MTRFRYGNVTTQQVIALALEISDFTGADATLLAELLRPVALRDFTPDYHTR